MLLGGCLTLDLTTREGGGLALRVGGSETRRGRLVSSAYGHHAQPGLNCRPAPHLRCLPASLPVPGICWGLHRATPEPHPVPLLVTTVGAWYLVRCATRPPCSVLCWPLSWLLWSVAHSGLLECSPRRCRAPPPACMSSTFLFLFFHWM